MRWFKKTDAPEETYLECYSPNGCVYRVVGSTSHYRVEITCGTQRCKVAELRRLAKAHALALKMLDHGSVPKGMQPGRI